MIESRFIKSSFFNSVKPFVWLAVDPGQSIASQHFARLAIGWTPDRNRYPRRHLRYESLSKSYAHVAVVVVVDVLLSLDCIKSLDLALIKPLRQSGLCARISNFKQMANNQCSRCSCAVSICYQLRGRLNSSSAESFGNNRNTCIDSPHQVTSS